MQNNPQGNLTKHHAALPEGWKTIELGKCSKIQRGKFAHRPRNAPQFYGGSMPFVQTGDVSSSGGYIRRYSQTLSELGCSISKVFPKGTLLITIAANIGDCGILEFESACPDSTNAAFQFRRPILELFFAYTKISNQLSRTARRTEKH